MESKTQGELVIQKTNCDTTKRTAKNKGLKMFSIVRF